MLTCRVKLDELEIVKASVGTIINVSHIVTNMMVLSTEKDFIMTSRRKITFQVYTVFCVLSKYN